MKAIGMRHVAFSGGTPAGSGPGGISDAGVEIDRIVQLPRQINPRRDKYC